MATMYRSTNGNATVTHESDDLRPGKALCGRSIIGALNLSEMSGWERMGFDAASNGPCANCSRKLHAARTAPAKETIMIDNTPAGIFAAMMRANATEQTAPQSRLYGLLSDHLQRTLAATYGDAAPAIYGAIIRSGEASDDVISGALDDYAWLAQDALDYPLVSGGQATSLQRLTAAAPHWTPMPCPRPHRSR